MSSVTARIAKIKQPYLGYIRPGNFKEIVIEDGITLNENINVHPSIVGLVVDYLTRFVIGNVKKEAFKISLQGAARAEKLGEDNAKDMAKNLLIKINGTDEDSIVNACKLVAYDVWYRNPMGAIDSYKDINPNKDTIHNIQILIKRSIDFFKDYGPVIKFGFDFEPVKKNKKAYKDMIRQGIGSYGGYTAVVDCGDGDFLTSDTLWDFKVSKKDPTSKHTLQLLMYWIMGQHSGQEIYKNIKNLGIFNPYLNKIYLLNDITHPFFEKTIKIVEKEIICYGGSFITNGYRYTEEFWCTGEAIWYINEEDESLDGVTSLVEKYIDEYKTYREHGIIIYNIYNNDITNEIKVFCQLNEIQQIVDYIHHIGKNTALEFIGYDRFKHFYYVGMQLSTDIITSGSYRWSKKKKLDKIYKYQ